MSLLLSLSLAIGPLAGGDSPIGSDPPSVPLSGGFIQIQGWMRDMPPEDWRRELAAMREIGMDLVIIQYLETDRGSYLPQKEGDPDPVRVILGEAQHHGMQVFLGTKVDRGWWNWNAEYLAEALVSRKRLLEDVQSRYGPYPSFSGWYFTEECSGGLSPERVRMLRAYFADLSRHARSLRDVPVAFAPFFSDVTPVESMRRIYRDLLDGAGIDILMLQDGVGARGWDAELEDRIVPMFQMFEEVCRERGVELWSDLESFRLNPEAPGSPRFVPTDIDRLERQRVAVSPFVSKIVTFDFFHYMSPHRGVAQKRLYEGYQAWVRSTPHERSSTAGWHWR